MAYVWLYCVVLLNTLYFLYAEESCTKTLSLCKLKIGGDSPIKLPSIGPKGETGDSGGQGKNGEPGDPGPRGLIGDNGLTGLNGIPGSQGSKGLKGSSGDQGPTGDPGVPGSKGITGKRGGRARRGDEGITGPAGAKGVKGIPGLPGPQGPDGNLPEEGDKGIPGPIGLPGDPGSIGECLCPIELVENSYEEDVEFGKKDSPSSQTCKYSTDLLKNGTDYFIGPGPITVRCIPRGNLTMVTCIPAKNSSVKLVNGEKHWLSQRNLTIEELYGINRNQLEWLQRNSESAYQTIRYHCLNSNPFPRDKVENSLLLLTWNDNTIGPMPTLTKPFFYSVPNNTDWCSYAADDKWSSTDIKLVSESIQRVPVIDFFIRDIRPGKNQAVKIEHFELCFD